MNVTVEVPDAIAHHLHLDGPQAGRRTLEMVALAGYQSGELTRGKVGELLGLSFYETEEFLKKNGAEIRLTMDEVQRSTDALERLIAR
jgi:predicted HTH domain antitoxin